MTKRHDFTWTFSGTKQIGDICYAHSWAPDEIASAIRRCIESIETFLPLDRWDELDLYVVKCGPMHRVAVGWKWTPKRPRKRHAR